VADTTASRGDYLLLGLASLGYACLTFVWFSVAAFLPVLTTGLGLSGTDAGLLTGIIPLVYVPFSLASGLAIDRIGAPRAIATGLLLFGVAQLARGFAPGFPTLLALTGLVGLGGTAITFGLPKLVAERFSPTRSGTLSSVYLLGSYLGIAAAFGLGRAILGPLLGGWRPVFRWSGLAVLGFALVWIAAAGWVARRHDHDADRRTGETDTEHDASEANEADGGTELGTGTAADAESEEDRTAVRSIGADLKRVGTHPEMRLLVLVGAMYLFTLHGLQNWLAVALEARGVGPSIAAGMATLFVAARALGTLSIPPLSDLLSRRRGAVMTCGALAAIGVLGLLRSGTALVLTGVVITLVGVGLGGLGPLVRALPIEFEGIGPEFTGTAVGLIFAIGELGGFAGPFLVGAIRDLTGSFEVALSVFVLGGLLVVFAGYAITEPSEQPGA
jgi:cyanate permease